MRRISVAIATTCRKQTSIVSEYLQRGRVAFMVILSDGVYPFYRYFPSERFQWWKLFLMSGCLGLSPKCLLFTLALDLAKTALISTCRLSKERVKFQTTAILCNHSISLIRWLFENEFSTIFCLMGVASEQMRLINRYVPAKMIQKGIDWLHVCVWRMCNMCVRECVRENMFAVRESVCGLRVCGGGEWVCVLSRLCGWRTGVNQGVSQCV